MPDGEDCTKGRNKTGLRLVMLLLPLRPLVAFGGVGEEP